jgi:hypothetical protein
MTSEARLFIFAAIALPVLGRAEYALAEKPVPFGLKGAVVYGLRLLDLAPRPLDYPFRAGQPD